ncbi:MAG TPA: type II secretion system F family protein [Egicoccus sp.]|nr:type II secretion system F family protein [Egicoccus sp.]HSK25035.1 type II secretion system F family protein [Egicoccus sp.]
MTLLLALAGLLLWAGLTLLFAELRWFSRPTLVTRLGPYVRGGMGVRAWSGVLAVETFREAVGPIARRLGEAFSRLFGVSEQLDRKLRRVHSPLDVTEFRVRQVGWAVAALLVGALFTVASRPPPPIALLFMLGGLLLAFLLQEQQVAAASKRWQREVHLELPVVAEQIAMLLGAGYSLAGALDRVASRGRGAVASDLRRVLSRIRQGVGEEAALQEWSELADVVSVDRFVSVLALNREASDLGRLIAEEARAIRAEVQRELVEQLERRGQQVWIPVTVATLLPGVIFIAIPFMRALDGFLGR